MKFYIAVESRDGNPIQNALLQIICLETAQELEIESDENGNAVLELDSGSLEEIRCLVYCNGSR